MSLEQPVTETVWFSVIFTLTSWITSSLLLVQMPSSDRCGQNLSGKTKLVVFFLFVCYFVYEIQFCLLFYSSSLQQHYLLPHKPHSTSSLDVCLEWLILLQLSYQFHKLSNAITGVLACKRGCVHWALPLVWKLSKLTGDCCIFWLKGEMAASISLCWSCRITHAAQPLQFLIPLSHGLQGTF